MSIVIFNLPGIVFVVISFAIAFGVGHLAGTTAEGPLMMIAGPLCILMDLLYRLTRPERRLFHPSFGGAIFFIPVWALGALWLVLGIVYVARGRASQGTV